MFISTPRSTQARSGQTLFGSTAPLIASLFLLLASVSPMAWAADGNIENHPGYVDFTDLSLLTDIEPTVEVSLKTPLLNMITNLMRNEDEEAAEFISKLERVSVKVFPTELLDADLVAESMEEISEELDQSGWERVVRVREGDDHVDVYFRLSDNAETIYGIAIMVAEPEDTVLVNIVGDISVEDISALGRRFDIDELVDIEIKTEVDVN